MLPGNDVVVYDNNKSRGKMDGAVVRAFTSHQCGPASIPGLDVG